MKTYRLRLSNDRELDIKAPTLEDAAGTALEQYPGEVVTGWGLLQDEDEPEEVEE